MAKEKIYSICSSTQADPKIGHMRYVVGKSGNIEFVFPAKNRPPSGAFHFSLAPRGASIEFNNESFRYKVHEDVNDSSSIEVTKAEKRLARIACESSTDTLTLNSTIDRMQSFGIKN